MKKYILILAAVTGLQVPVFCQNVGIGTTTPAEKLDVNGNINLNGNLKVNSIAGQPGQVLMTATNGATEWGALSGTDACQYKNFVAFNFTGGVWTIPAGVSRILVEAWGGGGGGSSYAGGGGGGYIKAQFNVEAGASVTVVLGQGGSGASTSNAAPGGETTVTVTDNTATTYTLYGLGGQGAYSFGSNIFSAYGGGFTVNPGYNNYTGLMGQPGFPATYSFSQNASGSFLQISQGGRGGDGGNTINTGGVGGFVLQNSINAQPSDGMPAGGGGGSSASAFTNGGYGGRGRVVIWY